MTAALTAWGAEAVLASALLMALVLLVRGPVRRIFGPQIAYGLWALPALRLVLPPMPASWREQAAMPISRASDAVTVLILPGTAPVAEAPAMAAAAAPVAATGFDWSGIDWLAIGAGLWLAGALAFFVHHCLSHRRFCRRLLRDARLLDRIDGVAVVESHHATGPLAFGIKRRFVAFPRDFDERYDADERLLALAHELGHHQRGDLVANWAALAVLALHWFNPLAWRAFRAFRADQELANDARVLAGRSRADRHIYACAIVKAAHGGAVSAACHLHTITDLKGRLKMLTIAKPSRTRLMTGAAAVLGVVTAGLIGTASGTSATAAIAARMGEATGGAMPSMPAMPAMPPMAKTPAVPDARSGRTTRVVVVKNGKTTTYEGSAAEAYLADHPAPVPPVPPVAPRALQAPVAPTAPAAPGAASAMGVALPAPPVPPRPLAGIPTAAEMRAMVDIRSGSCGPDTGAKAYVVSRTSNGHRSTVICTDRIQAAARAGRLTEADQVRIQRESMTVALSGLETARAALASNASIPAQGQREALAGIDESMADLRQQMAEIGKD